MTALFPDLLAIQHFHFLRPYWLLMAIPILGVLKALKDRDDNLAIWRSLMSSEILQRLTVKGNNTNFLSPMKVSRLIAVLLVIVLAGPSWQQQPSPLTEDKSALIIALDVSATMNQADVQPSRLLRAKQKINELLALRGDANTALIAYSGSAHVVMPITNDSDMVRHFLDALDYNLMPKPGKLPQTVLPIAKQLLQPTLVPGTLLMVGDGASAETVNKFSQFFAVQPHQLVVWAIGNTQLLGSPTKQQSMIIPIQLAQLEALADNSHGRLVLMSHDKQDIGQINRYIENNLVIVEDASRPWFDAGYPLVFVIALLFLLWFRRGWTLQW